MSNVRFHILSDLHIDSYSRRGLPVGDIPVTDCDAVIVAGDTANGEIGIRWLIEQAARLDKPFFVIAGNHEYFGHDVNTLDSQLRAMTVGTGVNFLQCDMVMFRGIRLLGTTLWTDYQYQANVETLPTALRFMQDYQAIRWQSRLFTPQDSIVLHERQRAWLLAALQQAAQDHVPTLVISHHSISPRSVSQKYANFSSNAGFVSDLSDWLTADFAPKLWVHGHTHEAFDYVQGNTRVVVNPRAYPSEISSTGIVFDWGKVVTV